MKKVFAKVGKTYPKPTLKCKEGELCNPAHLFDGVMQCKNKKCNKLK